MKLHRAIWVSLLAALKAHGYGKRLIAKIAWRNWVAALERTIG